jgi:DNA modification methylase
LSNFKVQRVNANRHTQKGLRELENSIQRDGWIGAQTAAADQEIFDGSARLEVAEDKFDGVEPIIVESDGTRPVIVVRTDIPNADHPKAKRLAIGANAIAKIDLDFDPEILAALANEDPAIANLLKQDADFSKLLQEPKEETADAGELVDRAAELQEKWQVQRGDVWQIGKHRLMCGDSTSAEDVGKLMGRERVMLIPTSPPYDNSEAYEKGKTRDDWQILIDGISQTWANVLASSGVFALNMGNRVGKNNIGYCGIAIEASGLTFLRRVVWKKPDGAGIPSHGHTHKKPIGLNWHPMMVTEDILIYFKDERRSPLAGFQFDTELFTKFYTDCWQFAGVQSDVKAGHPAAFPVLLPTLLISFLSVEGDLIGEPFNGSGTTLVACEQTGRIARGMEIEPKYCSVTLERLSLLGLNCERVNG